MSEEYRRVRLWQAQATDKAILFHVMPPGDPKPRTVWIPRSQIKHISRDPPVGGLRECIVDVAEWFAEKEDL